MGLRYLGNYVSPSYNPLASNITTGANVVQAQGVYTLVQQADAQGTQKWVTDPVFQDNTLLIQADGFVNGSQNNTFLDSSTNGYTVVRNGNPTQGAFSPFGVKGGYWCSFQNTGNLLIADADSGLTFGTGDFTIEFWFLNTKDTGQIFYWDQRQGSNSSTRLMIRPTDILYGDSTSIFAITNWATRFKNQWAHFALTRESGVFRYFLNGVLTGTNSSLTSLNMAGGQVRWGARWDAGLDYYPLGLGSNLRVVKGVCLYNASFTPSTKPLEAVSGTTLLTLCNNIFSDASSSNRAITPTANIFVQPYSPFVPDTAYIPSVNAGGGYFDYTGDYLSITTSPSNFYSANGDWTWEAWVYPLSFNGPQYSCPILASSIDSVLLRANPTTANTTSLNMYAVNSAGSVVLGSSGTNGGTIRLNEWSHVVLQRRVGEFDMYLNGSRVANNNTQTTATLRTTDTGLFIGSGAAGTNPFWNGYIAGVRIQNGSAKYSGTTITVPTSPPSPTGAAICVNFANGGVYDTSGRNMIETVGNAQVSTFVVKYGSGAMYFDGSGDYLRFMNGPNPTFSLSTDDFTIEGWIYLNASTNQTLFDIYDGNSVGRILMEINTSRQIAWLGQSAANRTTTTGSLPLFAWSHFAVCRASGLTRIFIDGVQANTTYTDTNNYTCTTGVVYFGINGADASSSPLNAYVDDLRITKGFARYITNFTPPQVALPRQ